MFISVLVRRKWRRWRRKWHRLSARSADSCSMTPTSRCFPATLRKRSVEPCLMFRFIITPGESVSLAIHETRLLLIDHRLYCQWKKNENLSFRKHSLVETPKTGCVTPKTGCVSLLDKYTDRGHCPRPYIWNCTSSYRFLRSLVPALRMRFCSIGTFCHRKAFVSRTSYSRWKSSWCWPIRSSRSSPGMRMKSTRPTNDLSTSWPALGMFSSHLSPSKTPSLSHWPIFTHFSWSLLSYFHSLVSAALRHLVSVVSMYQWAAVARSGLRLAILFVGLWFLYISLRVVYNICSARNCSYAIFFKNWVCLLFNG